MIDSRTRVRGQWVSGHRRSVRARTAPPRRSRPGSRGRSSRSSSRIAPESLATSRPATAGERAEEARARRPRVAEPGAGRVRRRIARRDQQHDGDSEQLRVDRLARSCSPSACSRRSKTSTTLPRLAGVEDRAAQVRVAAEDEVDRDQRGERGRRAADQPRPPARAPRRPSASTAAVAAPPASTIAAPTSAPKRPGGEGADRGERRRRRTRPPLAARREPRPASQSAAPDPDQDQGGEHRLELVADPEEARPRRPGSGPRTESAVSGEPATTSIA